MMNPAFIGCLKIDLFFELLVIINFALIYATGRKKENEKLKHRAIIELITGTTIVVMAIIYAYVLLNRRN